MTPNFFFLVLACSCATLLVLNSPSLALPECHGRERSALLQFKHSFHIDCAIYPSAYPKMNSWTGKADDNCCLWDGVKCDDKTSHVIRLDLSRSCIHGSFPVNSSIFTLKYLQMLSLASNDFNYSQVPSELDQLQHLRSLNLSHSRFSGQIPLGISHLSQLTLLDLSWNGDASISSQLILRNPSFETLVKNLTRLQKLYLTSVDISSSVPKVLTNITSLQVISLGFCNLYGELPTALFSLPHLEAMLLFDNMDLGGHLPEFTSTSSLKALHFFLTTFSGELPRSIGILSNLEVLFLSGCRFTGSVPASLGNLTKLTVLDLGYNNFTGDIPHSITNLTQLQVLDISNVKTRTQSLISQLPRFHKLTTLQLSQLDIAGEIPSFLANMTTLKYLDLSSNLLKGLFPHSFSNLTQLAMLRLDNNQLTGSIPPWFSKFTYLQMLTLSYNLLFTNLNIFFQLKNLLLLSLSGNKIIFPFNESTISPQFKLQALELDLCNLTEFPQFLHNQNELQSLSISGNNIKGTIPQWFVNITKESLLEIDISNNNLTGFVEQSLFLPWNNLEILDLSNNKCQGPLPQPYLSESSIIIFQVSNNRFAGHIPKEICKASYLMILDLSNNNLSGNIPSCIIDQLANSMQVLNMRGNNFDGNIPQTFQSSCKLRMINLSQNKLHNRLPKSLANCKMLEVLDVGSNHLSDTFPAWLGSLSRLQVLVLSHNKFHGRIANPKSDLDFHPLRVIDLSDNIFTGALPSGYFHNWYAMKETYEGQSYSSRTLVVFYLKQNMVPWITYEKLYNYSITITNKGSKRLYPRVLNVLRVIDLSCNNFSGEIPSAIGDLKGLQALNLSNNNLHGIIPSSIENIIDLESLDLSSNILSGIIPQGLPRLTYLAVFNVSYNNLVGPIPQGKQFNTFDNSSFEGNLGLCGSQQSKKCENQKWRPTLEPVAIDEKQDTCELVDWIIKLLGCASGCLVGFIVGKYQITDRYHEWFVETFGRRKRKPAKQKEPKPRYQDFSKLCFLFC